MNRRIAVLAGDGIGVEVTREAVLALEEVASLHGHRFELTSHPIGGAALSSHDVPLPDSTLEACLASDAVLLGAVGGPAYDDLPRPLRPETALLALRKALGLYANLRPVRVLASDVAASPLRPERVRGTDLVIVRELSGGLYFGEPRRLDAESAVNTLTYTASEIERVARRAFDLARSRRRHVTSVDKANVLETSQLWRSVVTRVARDYPDVALAHLYVDNAAMQLVLRPASFDVILTENLFGDILSDEGAVLVGSLGLLPSASLGDGPSLFEPIHGSAPDIAGRNVANPLGAIRSAALLLRLAFGLHEEASGLERAVDESLAAGRATRDLGGSDTTSGIGTDIRRRLRDSHRQSVTFSLTEPVPGPTLAAP